MTYNMGTEPNEPTSNDCVPLDHLVRQLDRDTGGYVPSPTLSKGLAELMAWMSQDGGTAPASVRQPPRTRSGIATPSAPQARIRVVVANGNPVVRAGLKGRLARSREILVVAEAADGRQAQDVAHYHRPDIVLVDVRMPGENGFSAIPHLAQFTSVMVLTHSREPETVQRALRQGANGYLVHGEFTADELVAAIRDVVAGRPRLGATAAAALMTDLRQDGRQQDASVFPDGLGSTARDIGRRSGPVRDRAQHQLSTAEAHIMSLVASGMSDSQIATSCVVSARTIRNRIERIFAKLDSTNRADAVAKWLGLTAPGAEQGVAADRTPGQYS
ncbi:response regulator transcription factor [Streptomyces sp. NPDC004539]|uniref:response regulator transcription factor n=1 Tax=Streptomyces sp. NPDC004539 TaxID=3154280 RepID=UPI0033B7051D